MQSGHGRHGGNQGKTDKHEAVQAKARETGVRLSGARDEDGAHGHTSGRDET